MPLWMALCGTAALADESCQEVFSSGETDIEVHEDLLQFDFIQPALMEKIKTIKKVNVKNPSRIWQLQQIHHGKWQKVYIELYDGREIHFFEHVEDRWVADAKFK